MPIPPVHKKVKDPEGKDVFLTKDSYRHIKKAHPEVVTWLDTLLEAVSNPDEVLDYGDDKTYIKRLPAHVKSFVQPGVEYCLIPVTKRPEGYLGIKSCYLINEETYKRRTWRF